MPARSEFLDYVVEQMTFIHGLRAKAMFGGFGIYQDDAMFAIIVSDTLYFKADAQTRQQFEAQGLAPFSYTTRGKTVTMQYYEAPPEVLENEDSMREWAELAIGAALRAKKPLR